MMREDPEYTNIYVSRVDVHISGFGERVSTGCDPGYISVYLGAYLPIETTRVEDIVYSPVLVFFAFGRPTLCQMGGI